MLAPADVTGLTRSRLLRRVAAGVTALGAGAATAAGLAQASGSARVSRRDAEILRFALSLEQLQSAFYSEALSSGRLTGEIGQFARVVAGQEEAHLRYVRATLGSGAAASQRFRFGDALSDNQRFIAAAVTLEETGLAAYNGQATNLSRHALGSVSRIISVEARHVAWARDLAGELPAPSPTDSPISAADALRRIRPFVQ